MHYKSLAVPKENNERQSETAEIAQDQTIDIPSTSRLEPSVILTYVPKRNQNKASALLNFLQKHDTLDWDSAGRLLVKGNPVEYSHIADLIHDALNHTKYNPAGSEHFYSNLGHVPHSLIVNPRRKRMLTEEPIIEQPKFKGSWGELWKKC